MIYTFYINKANGENERKSISSLNFVEIWTDLQPVFTFSKSAMETLGQCVKSAQS